ncbi:MAG: hypothetical protein IAE98_11440 [Candidatus Kapabacteria bacterium]|nr:hypothetical protein [Candidatus Kapabacteria bacterium]
MKIFLHTKGVDVLPINQYLDVDALPNIGEHISLSMTGPWFIVRVIVHTLNEDSHVSAEVYATQVDHLETLQVW